jgi:hypothetical protein
MEDVAIQKNHALFSMLAVLFFVKQEHLEPILNDHWGAYVFYIGFVTLAPRLLYHTTRF